jgi:Tol biopolymer transport system component
LAALQWPGCVAVICVAIYVVVLGKEMRMFRTLARSTNRLWLAALLLLIADSTQLFADDAPRITLATRRFGGVQLMTIGIDGSNPVQITKGDEIAREPAWSPDGSKLMYVIGPRGNGHVMIADPDGSNAKPLLPNETRAQRVPQWSPDGKQIALAINIPAKNMENVFLVNADGTELKDLDAIASSACDPIFSPDGKKFACVSHPPGTNGWIWIMNWDGTEKVDVVTGNLSFAVFPAWSPDGKQITFGAPGTTGRIQLKQVNVDGTGLTELVQNPLGTSYATWSADGQYLAYVAGPGSQAGDLCVYDVAADEHKTVLERECYVPYFLDGRPSWVPKKKAEKTGEKESGEKEAEKKAAEKPATEKPASGEEPAK